jgi:ketosteroid isomerase-like protein
MSSGESADPSAVAVRFNDCITNRDIEALTDLMTDDHTFTDTAGNTVSGRGACGAAWQGFFEAFPDYSNVFDAVTAADNLITIVGRSRCSEPALAGPALWTATIRGDKVARWRVYTDTPGNRHYLGLPDHS